MIEVKSEPMMGTETKQQVGHVSEIEDSPSIAPYHDLAEDHEAPRSRPGLKPQFQIAVAGGSAGRRTRMSVTDIAKSMFGVVGLVAGFGVYLVVILSVMAVSLLWMPFSRSDNAADRA